MATVRGKKPIWSKDKSIKSFLDAKEGMKFRVINMVGGHNYQVNTLYTYCIVPGYPPHPNGQNATNCAKERQGGNTLQFNQVEFQLTTYNRTRLRKEIIQLEQRVGELRKMLDWMDEVGVEDLDETDYKIYHTLLSLDTENLNIFDKKMLMEKVQELKTLL